MDISVDDTVMQFIEKMNDNEKRLFAHYFTTNKSIPVDIEINDYVQEVNELFQNSTTTNTDTRVAGIFGKKDPGLIPTVSKRSLKIYCEYLSHNLDLPLKVKFEGQDAVLLEMADTDVVDDLDFHGLLAYVRVGRKILTIPLVEIDLTSSNKSKEVVEDYQY